MNTKPDDIRIRPARHADRDTIAGFQLRMALETENLELNLQTVNRGVEAVLENPALGQYFVADFQGITVGSLLITYEWSDWRSGQVWWIQSVYILPEHRNKKIFSKMYHFLREKVEKNKQLVGLRLYVDIRNQHAQKVYEALGMNGDHYKTYEWIK